MKKSQLRNIIRESIRGLLTEQQTCSNPNARKVLAKNCGNGANPIFYCFTVDGGQVPQAQTVVTGITGGPMNWGGVYKINSIIGPGVFTPNLGVQDGNTIPNAVDCGSECNGNGPISGYGGCTYNFTGNAPFSNALLCNQAGCSGVDTYDCDGNYNCVVAPPGQIGAYNTGATAQDNEAACLADPLCQAPPEDYECVNGQCIAQVGGQFNAGPTTQDNISDCQAVCTPPSDNCHEDITGVVCDCSGPDCGTSWQNTVGYNIGSTVTIGHPSFPGFTCGSQMCDQALGNVFEIDGTYTPMGANNLITLTLDSVAGLQYDPSPDDLPSGTCPTPPDTYDCDINYQCVVNTQGTGYYNGGLTSQDNEAACLADPTCQAPIVDTFDCNQNGQCVVNQLGMGQFNSGPLTQDNYNACIASPCIQGCDPNTDFHSWPSYYNQPNPWMWMGPTIQNHPMPLGNDTVYSGNILHETYIHWYMANQGSYCEWCDDFVTTGGPFDSRTDVWVGAPHNEDMCSCCPGNGYPHPPLPMTKPISSDDDDIPWEKEKLVDLQERFQKLANIKK